MLPPVHELVGTLSKDSELSGNVETTAITWAARNALTKARNIIVNGRTDKARTIDGQKTFLDDTAAEDFQLRIRKWLREEIIRDLKGLSSTLQRIINATGVVLHTNCGRALLARKLRILLLSRLSLIIIGIGYSHRKRGQDTATSRICSQNLPGRKQPWSSITMPQPSC